MSKTELFNPSSIENVDFAFYDWLDLTLNLSCSSKDGFKKVPVIWVTPERAFQVKNNKEFRDIDGTLNVPLITLERTSIIKDQRSNGTYFANLPGADRQIVAKRINQKKTSEFANADNKKQKGSVKFLSPKKNNQKIVYQYSSMKLPVYATFTYNVTLFTQFQQQMNELVQPFLTRTGSLRHFIIEKDGYKYECFIENNIDTKNNVASMEEEERRYVSSITIKVLATVLSQGENEDDTVIKTFENAVELKFPRENIILAKTEKPEIKPFDTPQSSNYAAQVYSNVLMKKVFLIGNGVDSVFTLNHNFNTRDVLVIVRENFPPDYARVEVAIDYSNLNNITVDMGGDGDRILTNSYSVTIMG